MSSTFRKSAVVLCTGALLVGGAGSASAARSVVVQDGLVNVAVNDVVVQDTVDLAAAVQAVILLCDIDVGPLAVAVLGQAVAVDRSGNERTICEGDTGAVTIEQNSAPTA